MSHYKTEAEIEAVIRGFETCTTDKDGFSHADHLAAAVWYLKQNNEEQAMNAMRESLLRFLNHHGIGTAVYNETITRFWVRVVSRQLTELPSGMSLAERTNAVVAAFANSRLVFDHYSKELVNTPEAKNGWVEPDLKDFDYAAS